MSQKKVRLARRQAASDYAMKMGGSSSPVTASDITKQMRTEQNIELRAAGYEKPHKDTSHLHVDPRRIGQSAPAPLSQQKPSAKGWFAARTSSTPAAPTTPVAPTDPTSEATR